MHQDRHEAGEYRGIELITGETRRRQWTTAEKAALVAESLQPGINMSALARRHGVNRGLLQTWRRAAMREATDRGHCFVPICVEEPSAPADAASSDCRVPSSVAIDPEPATTAGVLQIECGDLRVRFSGPIDAGALRVVLAHVGRRA
jgi:transposase